MQFPKNRMRFTTSYQGKTEPEGWIALDLAGVELDGVSKIYISLADIEQIKQSGDTATEKLKRARALLGGDDED